MPLIIVCLTIAFQQTALAQDTTKPKKEFKNNIHFNITNPFIFGDRSLIFGYERQVNKRSTFTINVGPTGFPTLNIINSDSLKANTIRDEKGFHLSGDYRFYLAKENKYNVPRGVYIGPYFSYNYFEKDHSWELKTASGASVIIESNTNLTVNTLGIELGYQFVFWNRVSLDMILAGPGVSSYRLEADLGTNLSDADRQKFFEKLNEALAEKFPGYGLAVNEGEFRKTGSTNTTTFGFRYMVQLGFRI